MIGGKKKEGLVSRRDLSCDEQGKSAGADIYRTV